MARGCDHAAERKGGGRNNKSSKRRMETSNNPHCTGTGAGRASPWRGRGAVSHGWRDSPLCAWSSNHHPYPPGRGGSPCSARWHILKGSRTRCPHVPENSRGSAAWQCQPGAGTIFPPAGLAKSQGSITEKVIKAGCKDASPGTNVSSTHCSRLGSLVQMSLASTEGTT